METVVIPAEKRQPGGRHANQYLRNRGRLPAIVYGHNEAPEAVSLPAHEMVVALEHGARALKLLVNKKEQHVLIKEVQYDHLGMHPIHMDLARVDLNETITVRVPIDFRGTPAGTHDGGQLTMHAMDLEVECLASRIPGNIVVKIDHLHIGDSLYVKDVEAPMGIAIGGHPDDVVCTLRAPINVTEETEEKTGEEAKGAEPEVISRGKTEGEEPAS